MAIFAQRPRKTNSYLPDFQLVSTPQDGEAFIYDAQIGAFVNKSVAVVAGGGSGGGGGDGGPDPDPDLSNYVTDGINLSNNLQIFKQKNNQKLEFKGLIAGGGITLNNMGNDIRIANTVFETGHWLNSGIQIVFDNDGKMVFYKRGHRLSFNPTIEFSAPNEDITIVANNPGQLVSSSQNFEALGFFAGQKIKLAGSDEQDGEYTIGNVSGDTITLTTPFISNLDAGLQPPMTITGARLQFINSIKFALYGIDLSQEDIAVGDTIELVGTENNDGTYTIHAISGNQIEIAEVFSSPFNYEYGDITVSTPEEDLPIGLELRNDGSIIATNGTFNSVHTGELVADNITVGGESLESYIESITADLPTGGYLVGTDDGPVVREIEVGPGLIITNPDGYDDNTKIDVKDFFLNLTGDVTGYSVISGLANTNINIELEVLGSSGQYNLVTTDNKGRVTAGTKRIITAGPGMTIINGDMTLGDPVIHPNDFAITLTGAIEGTATVTDLGDVTIDTTLNIANPGLPTGEWFNRVQFDSNGWIIAGENQPILASNGVTITNPDGVAGAPVISVNDFDITITGDVTGQATVMGLSNTTISVALPEIISSGTYNQITVDTTGRVIAGDVIVYDFQPSNPLLNELSTPTFANGIITWDGNNYGSKVITGTADQITVTETSTEIQISIPDNPILTGNESVTIPYGPTNFRPVVPTAGMLRINTDETVLEAYINGAWRLIVPGTQNPSLELQGGTMQGTIDMDGNDISGIGLLNGHDIDSYFNIVDEINSGEGIKVSTSSGMVNRTLQTNLNNGLTIVNPDGVNGDPVISFSVFDFTTASTSPKDSDEVIFHDITNNETKKITVDKFYRRPARDYFMVQF